MGTGQGWHTVAEDCRIAPLEEDTQPPPEVRGVREAPDKEKPLFPKGGGVETLASGTSSVNVNHY